VRGKKFHNLEKYYFREPMNAVSGSFPRRTEGDRTLEIHGYEKLVPVRTRTVRN
jgi:hypothetical protein